MKLSTLYCRQMICSWWHSSYFLLPWWTNYIKLSLATYLLNFTTQKPGCSLSRAVLAAGWSVRSVIHLCETLIVLFEASEGRPAIRNVMLRKDADTHSRELWFNSLIYPHYLLHFLLICDIRQTLHKVVFTCNTNRNDIQVLSAK